MGCPLEPRDATSEEHAGIHAHCKCPAGEREISHPSSLPSDVVLRELQRRFGVHLSVIGHVKSTELTAIGVRLSLGQRRAPVVSLSVLWNLAAKGTGRSPLAPCE
ncbi:hypothetical protein NL676_027224 [Syzygium grande]|nr:hypothetical protein NL676_027224 [Syzygium grande]